MAETVLITIGLGIDLLGAFLITLPELAKSRKIAKEPEKIEMSHIQKYQYRKYGLIALMIGFVFQILGNSLRQFLF
ncbi:MAG: hypothetical protein ACREBI_09560 [Nitrosotalea sp.]